MDKLVELWIKAIDEREIEEYSKEVRDLYDYTMYLAKKLNQLETSIATKDSELLQLKEELRQLKTNRDEAIEYIKNHIQEGYSEVYDAEMRWDAVSGDDLLEILKGSDK
jgi:chromosome segregation ATPase